MTWPAAITATLGSAEAALQRAGDDAVLAEVVTKLKERAIVARTAVGETQSQVNAAATAMNTATELLAAARKIDE